MLLALDTSTRMASVALLDGPRVSERTAEVTTHDDTLLVMIDEVVRAAGARRSDLTAIAVGAGPGSYTGLRIGMATAKGLCFGLGRPLLLVSSLAAVAHAAGGDCVVVLDAGKGQAFFGLFRAGVAASPEVVLPPAGLAAELAARLPGAGFGAGAGAALRLAGDGARLFPEAAALGQLVHGERPHARDVGALAALRLAGGESDPLATAEPRYAAEWQPTVKPSLAR
ncbi:MAG: tRNA (adenosine(37)-N6)-threonylcarbamoyltransferase complex dimerization subunit type 1 TsaB [Deltaproteobacteria bacterium]|nr:tRNA (adenosine(37)-N6)-threonylcarbamoyltransferase complex dimerization subunit type 1 TsaB [Deltaproteobacteria bacterium]